MADINFQADELLAELGITDGNQPSGGPPAPPPPPPPAPVAKPVPIKTAPSKPRPAPQPTKSLQDELNEVFDSVISFAGKSSNRKNTPPPVAPKPKRKVHVSSYTINIGGAHPEPPKTAVVSQLPPAPAVAPAVVIRERTTISATISKPPEMPTAHQMATAFGPGLESFEVGTSGTFELSCGPDTQQADLDIKVQGPTGSKPVTIDELGTGQFSVEYVPLVAGEHKVAIKVRGKEIPGSPFTADVRYASYTDKAMATGAGLEFGTTDQPCIFVVQLKEDAGFTRMRVHILGPSRAEPVELVQLEGENSIQVTYHPTAPGDYTLRVLWGDAHVHGSPFQVPVTGPVFNDPTKVKVSGSGMAGGEVGETLKFFVEGEVGAGPGPLAVRMIGPSKPTLFADDSPENGVEVSFTCRDPGDYQLVIKWGDSELPGSPYIIRITGEGRELKPELCTATGDGLTTGIVSEMAKFVVTIPDEAGPGTLGVAVSGPHPPKPITITNNLDGTMDVAYCPLAPGEYTIEVTWADQHICGSPFKSNITGNAVRSPKLVEASGAILGGSMLSGQLGTISIKPGDGAGAGPLRAKMEGPAKADLHLQTTPNQCFEASFCPKEPGEYKLYFMWGDGDDAEAQIAGSPFSIKVEKK